MERFRQRIAEKVADFRSGGPILIVALGDSVTMGATAADVLEPEAVYHQRVKRMLEARYPGAVFSVINAGVGGETAADGLERLDRDVVRHQPDLVLVGFGLNDASDEVGRREAFEGQLRRIICRVRGQTQADVVLLTPNFMATRASERVVPKHRAMLPRMLRLQNEGHLAAYAESIRAVARGEGVSLADVHGAWEALAARGVDTTALLANGLNHPTGPAHAIAAEAVFGVIVGAGPQAGAAEEVAEVEVAAMKGEAA